MSKAKGGEWIRGKVPVLKTIGFGVEYEQGELYYDRMGRVTRRIADLDKGWLRNPQVQTNKTALFNPKYEMVFEFGPSAAGMTLNIENQPREISVDEAMHFIKQSEDIMSIVVDELEIATYQRIGYKEVYHFASESVEESEEWIRGLGIVNISKSLYAGFSGQHFAMGFAIILVGEECRYRIEVQGTERSAIVSSGQNAIPVNVSRSKRLNKTELLNLLSSKRARQLDPGYFTSVEIDSFLWDEIDTDFDEPHALWIFSRAPMTTSVRVIRFDAQIAATTSSARTPSLSGLLQIT